MFAFVLGMSTLFSFLYVWAARAFTKQFIWITGILSTSTLTCQVVGRLQEVASASVAEQS